MPRGRKGGRGGGRSNTNTNRNTADAKDANGAPIAQRYDSQVVEMNNQLFETYYKASQVSLSDKPLLISHFPHLDLLEYMKREFFPKLQGFSIDNEEIHPPTPMPWYPNGLAWVFDCGRTALRKSEQVSSFHKFLVSETEVVE
eukprot:jgi/Hompol1/6363/HPOL_004955-RA